MIRDSENPLEALHKKNITTVTHSKDDAKILVQMAKTMDYDTNVEKVGESYYVHMFSNTRLEDFDKKGPAPRNLIIIITDTSFGKGEETLGKALMKGYIYQLKNVKPYPKTIIFMNKGIFLACKDSEMIDDLKDLCHKGVEILSSSTCLDYYRQNDKLIVGGVASMADIVGRMNKGENTVII